MDGLTILAVIVFLFACWIFWRMVSYGQRSAAKQARQAYKNTAIVERVFGQIWNGEECSREAAWYRTVQRMRMGDYPEELVIEAELRLLMLQYGSENGRRSDYSVTSGGRVIHITERGGRDEPGPVGV